MSDIDTPPGISAVLRELDAIHRTIHENRESVKSELATQREIVKTELCESRAVVKAEMDTRFTGIEEKQDEQLDEARITNGRVRKLEIGYAVVKAAISGIVLLTPFILYFLNQ
jgi:hypothetical protein